METSASETLKTSNDIPSKGMLTAWKWLGLTAGIIGLAFLVYWFIHDVMVPLDGCISAQEAAERSNHSYELFYSPEDQVVCSGISWTLFVPLIIVGFVILIVATARYQHFYVHVYDGIVVDFDRTQSYHGVQYYHVCLEGNTLAGEKTRYWVEIAWRDWDKLQEGQRFRWK